MTNLKLILAPEREPVDLDELKVVLKITELNETDLGGIDAIIEDDYLNGLIKTARVMVESLCGPLITQTWEQYDQDFPKKDSLRLWKPRIQSVSSLTYTDVDNVATILSTDDYTLDDINKFYPSLTLNYGYSWPTVTLHTVNPIKTTFVCGYGDDPEDIERPIIQAIYLMCAHWYENREMFNISVSGNSVVPIPWSAEMLLSPYRTWGFDN